MPTLDEQLAMDQVEIDKNKAVQKAQTQAQPAVTENEYADVWGAEQEPLQEEQTEEVKTEEPVAEEEKVEETPQEDEEELNLRKRLNDQAAKRRKAEAQMRLLQEKIAVLEGSKQDTTDSAFEREVELRSIEKAKLDNYVTRATQVVDKGNKEYNDFNQVLGDFRTTFPDWQGVPRPLVEAIAELAPGDEHKIIHYLGKNMDKAEDIVEAMAASPIRGASILAKVVDVVNRPKPVSRAPAPIKPVGAAAVKQAQQTSQMSMEDFVKHMDKLETEKRIRRGY